MGWVESIPARKAASTIPRTQKPPEGHRTEYGDDQYKNSEHVKEGRLREGPQPFPPPARFSRLSSGIGPSFVYNQGHGVEIGLHFGMDFIGLHLGGNLEVVLFGEFGFGLFQELGQN